MKRILLSLATFIFIYLLAVIILNLLSKQTEPEQPEVPQIQIQEQSGETATPSADGELVVPDL